METIKKLDKKESADIEAKWMKIFCRNKRGYNTKAFRWHIFSGGGYPSEEGENAQKLYDEHFAAKYYVMFNNCETIDLVKAKPSDLNYEDVYVFPENMAWTMAFTHEEGWLGPYFAKHPQYEELENDALAYRKKQEQIACARSKGWC